MSDTDRVTARLAEMRKRYDSAVAHPETSRQMVAASADDVPYLVTALDRVLQLHQPEPGGDPAHPNLRVCSHCQSGAGASVWPCYEYEAISAALLGEGASGA